MTPQEDIEAMARDIAAMRQLLVSVRKNLLVIAIPFWVALTCFLVAVAFWAVMFFVGAGQ